MGNVFDVYISTRGGPSTKLTLPAAPYEILDVLERVMPNQPDHSAMLVEGCDRFEYLDEYFDLKSAPNLYGLNALAEKLLELNEYEATAFHGLVRIEADKSDGRLSLRRLLDLAYSTDCCYVAGDVLNYSQLGRFYADNGFVPEVENLSDEAFDMLDFEQIGRKMDLGEDGVFVERGFGEPGGYVVRYTELKQAPPIPAGPPQKPDYIFRLNLRLNQAMPAPPDGKRPVEIDLPASEEKIMAALDTLGASGLDDIVSGVLDSPLPRLRSMIFFGSEVLLVNELAQRLQAMDVTDLGVLKAVMEARGFDTLNDVIELAGRTDEYIIDPGILSVEQAAEVELNAMLREEDAELIIRHLNLHAYGKALLAQRNAVITPYGRLEREDGQPIQAMEQEPEMGGMEGMV